MFPELMILLDQKNLANKLMPPKNTPRTPLDLDEWHPFRFFLQSHAAAPFGALDIYVSSVDV